MARTSLAHLRQSQYYTSFGSPRPDIQVFLQGWAAQIEEVLTHKPVDLPPIMSKIENTLHLDVAEKGTEMITTWRRKALLLLQAELSILSDWVAKAKEGKLSFLSGA